MTTTIETCVHYWDLPPPDGHESLGTCRNCGETRPFKNTFEERDIWKPTRRRNRSQRDTMMSDSPLV